MEQELEHQQDPPLRGGERRRRAEIIQNDPDDDQWQDLSDAETFWIRVIFYKLLYSICGLGIGLACIIVGTVLSLNDLMGSTDRAVGIDELAGVVIRAALLIIGPIVIVLTRMVISPRASREAVSKKFWRTINAFALTYSITGLISAAATIVCGIILSLKIITATGWMGHVVHAALGVMLFGVGLFVITITKYDVKTMEGAQALGIRRTAAKTPIKGTPRPYEGIRKGA